MLALSWRAERSTRDLAGTKREPRGIPGSRREPKGTNNLRGSQTYPTFSWGSSPTRGFRTAPVNEEGGQRKSPAFPGGKFVTPKKIPLLQRIVLIL